MARPSQVRMHELEFCADVKSWCDALFASHPEWPFTEVKIEQYGRGNFKRQDLRIFRKGSQTPVLCGEVKMPGTPEGRTPYDPALMQDAFSKADNVQAPYFFTWNVNTLVMFDRSKWQVPMIERRIKDWDLQLRLTRPEDCRRPDVQAAVRDIFLPDLFTQFAEIVTKNRTDWGNPPDVVFIRSLESHLDWPVIGTSDYLIETAQKDIAFAAELQAWMAGEMGWTFDPTDPDDWRHVVDRAARTLCYIFCNRAIFYEAIRAKYPENLQPLTMPQARKGGHDGIYRSFRSKFQQAVNETGDYEPIFYPDVEDRVGAWVFASPIANQGWRGVFANIGQYNFSDIPYDIIGGIFQRLIAPEERQKFGQFYTNEDIVDIINAFCIRRAGDEVLDPACGSGSFLVRAYHRKSWLSEQRVGSKRVTDSHLRHDELLRGIYGCDIALFAAHLATLNLASRQISDEENYPFIARGNFFEIADDPARFCHVPGLRGPDGSRERIAVPMPQFDAVIGNPPYVRQEQIQKRNEPKRRRDETQAAHQSRLKNTKEHFQEMCSSLWPGLKLTGRSDLHCYFWPVAAAHIKEGGHFGFLTSSSWLDVEYGFALQRWILQNFRLVAVMESLDEPWFQDARVKTAITILQRCDSESVRSKNLVRFVRFYKPVRHILGDRPHGDESARQTAPENLRKLILGTAGPAKGETMADYTTDDLRIVTIPQETLWQEGVAAWSLLHEQVPPQTSEDAETEEDGNGEEPEAFSLSSTQPDYAAGKWGRFLRAPDLYFRLIRDYGNRFVRLGEVADVRFGIKSGCDAFFMPRDVTAEVLAQHAEGLPWNDIGLMTPCTLAEVQTGKVRIVKAGDNTLHPIETEYVRPEVHSLMQVDRPIIRTADTNRVVLWVGKELEEIQGTYATKYIRWGARQTFPSKKSKAVKVPERSTCAARQRWYDITSDRVGVSFWPKAQQYRHIIPANPEGVVCNCNLYTVIPKLEHPAERGALAAFLNSTIVALMKCFYGRYAGTEGALKTEVVDTALLEVPDPRRVPGPIAERAAIALVSMGKRKVTHMVEDRMLQCNDPEHMREILKTPSELPTELQQSDRRDLDDAVLEMIGVSDQAERIALLDELYRETAKYYRHQRTLEIQGAHNRSAGARGQTGPRDIAASIWDSLSDEEKGIPVSEWITNQWPSASPVDIPDGKASAVGAADMFDPTTVTFKQGTKTVRRNYANPEQAGLVAALADIDLRGEALLPFGKDECAACLKLLKKRAEAAEKRFVEIAAARTGQLPMQQKASAILMNWWTHGRT